MVYEIYTFHHSVDSLSLSLLPLAQFPIITLIYLFSLLAYCCLTERQKWCVTNFSASMASSFILQLAQSESPGAPVIVLKYSLQPDEPDVYI
jgi:hypothetical protein